MRTPPKLYVKPRKRSRFIVWYVLAFVLFARYVWLPELWVMPDAPVSRFQNQARFQGNGPRQFQRAPTHVSAPVSSVPSDLPRLRIEVSEEDMQRLREYHWNGWGGGNSFGSRPEVMAVVRDGDTIYTNVSLHPKGAAGSFRPIDDKPALTLNFSKHAPGQKFRGYTKLSLNNSVQDASYLCEAITRELFQEAGVPAPQASHATVILNNRDLGFYVLAEGYGKTFLKRHFKNTKGNLYDSGFCQEVTQNLSVNSGENPDDKSDLKNLVQAASIPDLTNRWIKLNARLDMDRFLSFLAMEVLTCHWDGYSLNRNNYRVFHDLESDQMIFMPHGTDQMFGANRSSPTSPILPSMRGVVARAVMATPQGRKAYIGRVTELSTNVFVAERITARVREISSRIRPTLAAYGTHYANEHDAQVSYLCQRITERAGSIAAQLASLKEVALVPAQGPGYLKNWRPHVTEADRGRIELGKIKEDEKSLLHIKSNRGGSASWRTRVALEPGRYWFEGRARTKSVGSDGLVGLRISGVQTVGQQIPEGQWVLLKFPIDVSEPLSEVDLVCELRGSRAEAWFDEDSLRVSRR